MTQVKISQLPAALGGANGDMLFEVSDGGASVRLTAEQLKAFAISELAAVVAGKQERSDSLSALDLLTGAGYLRRTGDFDYQVVSPATVANLRALTGQSPIQPAQLAAAAEMIFPSGAGNWTPDWTSFFSADWVITASRTLGNPTNVIPGTSRMVTIRGNNTTQRTITLGTAYRGSGALRPVTSASVVTLSLYAFTPTQILFTALDWQP